MQVDREIRQVNEPGAQEASPRKNTHHFAKKDHESRIDPLELLNYLLEKKGLSPKNLAQILELDGANAQRILKGTRSITPVDAARLGEHFNVRPALFLSLEYYRRDSRGERTQEKNQAKTRR